MHIYGTVLSVSTVISKKTGGKTYILFTSWKLGKVPYWRKNRIRIRNFWYGPAYLVQYKNVTDPAEYTTVQSTLQTLPACLFLLIRYRLETRNSETQQRECWWPGDNIEFPCDKWLNLCLSPLSDCCCHSRDAVQNHCSCQGSQRLIVFYKKIFFDI